MRHVARAMQIAELVKLATTASIVPRKAVLVEFVVLLIPLNHPMMEPLSNTLGKILEYGILLLLIVGVILAIWEFITKDLSKLWRKK